MELVAVVAVSLRLSADAWAIIMTPLTLAALGVAILGARFHGGHVRAFCVGAAIVGWAWFYFFTSEALARAAAQPYRRIAHSLVTIPVAAAGGTGASLCYCRYSRSKSESRNQISGPCEHSGQGRPTSVK